MEKMKKALLMLMSAVLLLVFSAGCGSSEVTTSNTNDSGSDSTEVKTNEMSTYKLNEDIFITSSKGKYRIKFTKISETKDRNEFSDVKADKVVIIEYEYENLELEEDLYVSDMSFKLYDKDNNQLESYPATETKYSGKVSKGRKATASEAYALNNASNYIELEYYDNMFNDKADCKVIFEW